MGSPRDRRSSDSFGGFSRSWTPTAGEVSWRQWPGPPSGNRPWCCGRNPRLNGEGMCSEPRRCGLGEFCVWRWGCHISKLQKGRKLVKSYQKSGELLVHCLELYYVELSNSGKEMKEAQQKYVDFETQKWNSWSNWRVLKNAALSMKPSLRMDMQCVGACPYVHMSMSCC